MQYTEVENDLLSIQVMLPPELRRVDRLESLRLRRISNNANAGGGDIELQQLPSVLLRQGNEVIELIGFVMERRAVVHIIETALQPATSVEATMHM